MGNYFKRLCHCLFPPKPELISADMYQKILEYRKKESLEESNFKQQSEENAKFLYGNLR